jgi:hypothetical protein
MSGLVDDLTSSMEAIPPPPHSLGAHLLKARFTTGQHTTGTMQHGV